MFKLSTLTHLMLYIRVELRNRYLKLLQIEILYCTEQKNIRSGSQSFQSKHTYVISLIIVIIILLID